MDEINKKMVFSIGSYSFKNYIVLSEQEQEEILSWRNHLNNRKWMLNPEIIPLEDHQKFIEGLKNKDNSLYWMVLRDEEPIGGVSLINVDYNDKKAELGYFLAPEKQGSGIGLDFLFHTLLLVFNELNFQFIEANVRDSNVAANTLNLFLGFKYTDKYSKNISKEDILFNYGILEKRDFYKNIETKNNINCFIQYYKSKNRK